MNLNQHAVLPRHRMVASSALPFSLTYCNAAQTERLLDDNRLLVLIQFHESAITRSHPQVCTIPLRQLDENATVEAWLGSQPAHIGTINGVHYADDGHVLFLRIQLDEFAPDALQPLTAVAYRRLFAVARERGYPHFLRVWNYFPNINQQHNDLERYRTFCAGRHQTLVAELAEFETHLPAACALGTYQSGLHLYALASREAGIQIENPRQISAFHYPRQYGFRSPSFSRAILKAWEGQWHLYISGTASIVGHASRHPETMAQLDETLLNLQALLDQAQRSSPEPLEMALLKVYCRKALDPTPLRRRIEQAFGVNVPILFLHADICRQELLVEIEGLAVSTA